MHIVPLRIPTNIGAGETAAGKAENRSRRLGLYENKKNEEKKTNRREEEERRIYEQAIKQGFSPEEAAKLAKRRSADNARIDQNARTGTLGGYCDTYTPVQIKENARIYAENSGDRVEIRQRRRSGKS